MTKHDGHVWKKNAQNEFNDWAKTYDRSILNKLLFHRCYLKFMEIILKKFSAHQKAISLLDVGCGTGTFLSMLTRLPLRLNLFGLDMAVEMCKLAHQKSQQVKETCGMNFLAGDSEHLPFADCSFDIITCSNSFHHYPHQNNVLCEFHRILKDDGMIIILDGYRDNILGKLIFDVGVGHFESSVHHCSAREMYDNYEKTGFHSIRQEKFGLFVPVLASIGHKQILKSREAG